ncbi:MAG TPA: sigma-70 family RNA polymerase sigma factor [Marmoricola sp.]|nr:sigma-70 family RNA polymerase sigma factor [Marmoricola sp.]
MGVDPGVLRGLAALRDALADILAPGAPATVAASGAGSPWWLHSDSIALAGATISGPRRRQGTSVETESAGTPGGGHRDHGDSDLATSSAEDAAVASRLIALVELARSGDKEAFGQLYDHYQPSVYRFLYYRVGSTTLAEDLTAETFFRALRSMHSFRWQGKDFGAWLMTIARNLTADHFKAGRTRLEQTTEDMQTLDTTSDGPEIEVLSSLTNETLLRALGELPTEQRECLIMRFLQGLSIAETAEILGRSSGAVKQLQLRGVRNLAKLIPAGERE